MEENKQMHEDMIKMKSKDNQIIQQQMKKPKIKRKKYQSIGHELVKLFTMVMHK